LQLINHSVPDDVVEGMKANIQQFFQFPAEVKKQFTQERGQLEGYGQLFVVSEDQKLDWADMLYLYTQPPEDRNLRFWPDQPANFKYDCNSSLPVSCLFIAQLNYYEMCFQYFFCVSFAFPYLGLRGPN
jgi:isopenicillin N synthase-like dioxygenase